MMSVGGNLLISIQATGISLQMQLTLYLSIST